MVKTLVAVPTYNGAHRVDWLLQSISMRTPRDADYRIVVCDDSGRPEHQEKTRAVVEKWKLQLPVELLINEKNMGLPRTWNKMVKSIQSEHCIMINDDIIVAPYWLESMVYFLDNNPKAGSCSHFCYFITTEDIPQLISSVDAIVIPRDPFKKTQTEIYNDGLEFPGRCMAPAGCFFGFRREIYDTVGSFDENIYTFYEEADWGTQCAAKGYPAYTLSWPKNWHLWSATFGSAPEIEASKVMSESRQYYIKKWQGHHDGPNGTHVRFMSKIPFQKVRWMYKEKKYEKVIDGESGYYLNDEDKAHAGILTEVNYLTLQA